MTDIKSKYPEEYSTINKVGSVFPFKASIQEFLYDPEIWVYCAINRQTVSKIR